MALGMKISVGVEKLLICDHQFPGEMQLTHETTDVFRSVWVDEQKEALHQKMEIFAQARELRQVSSVTLQDLHTSLSKTVLCL